MRRLRMFVKVALLGALVCSHVACSQAHIEPYQPKTRDYKMPVELGTNENSAVDGSLWSESSQRNFIYADQRAMRAGDILTVQVEEFANAQRDASTQTDRKAQMNADVKSFLNVMAKLQKLDPDLKPEALVDASMESGFSGRGETSRSERLTATVPAMVKKVFPNGAIFVEGHRVVMVNQEEHHFYVSGVARPQDIDESNVIISSRLADCEIEFTGRGVVTRAQEKGWMGKFFDWIWPF